MAEGEAEVEAEQPAAEVGSGIGSFWGIHAGNTPWAHSVRVHHFVLRVWFLAISWRSFSCELDLSSKFLEPRFRFAGSSSGGSGAARAAAPSRGMGVVLAQLLKILGLFK